MERKRGREKEYVGLKKRSHIHTNTIPITHTNNPAQLASELRDPRTHARTHTHHQVFLLVKIEDLSTMLMIMRLIVDAGGSGEDSLYAVL